MHKPEFILENEAQKILWDFELQTDCLLINKKKKELLICWTKRFHTLVCKT